MAFVGTGTSAIARHVTGHSPYALMVQAVSRAIDDAGLSIDAIDGLISTIAGDAYTLADHLGLSGLSLCMNNEGGCGSTGFAADVARWAIESGRCTSVVLVCGNKESDYGRSKVGAGYQARSGGLLARAQSHFEDLDQIWGATWLNQNALITKLHMHEFGTTSEQLAAVAVGNRYNAGFHPEAVYRDPITIDDVLSSKMISTPLTMLMCAMVNDGAAAAVMTSADRAIDLRHPPVYVLGSGSAFVGYTTTKVAQDPKGKYDLLRTVGELAADTAFRNADIERSEVDFIQMPDPFVIRQLLALESFGFCARGDAGPFVLSGATKLGGALPFNTYGGETSGSHAGTAHMALVEAIRQLQNVCGDRQIVGADTGLFASVSGKASTFSLQLLSR